MNQPDKTPTSPFPQRSNRKRGLRAAIGALTNFVYLWTASRPFKKLAWGLPALAVLVGLPVLSAMGSRGANPEEYAKRATQATEEKDFDAAKKWLQKLVKLQPENTRTQIVMANLMRESDGDAVADEELAKLAPLEGTQVGDPQAHRIAASRAADLLPTDPATALTHEHVRPLRDAITHLSKASQQLPQNEELLRQISEREVLLARLLLTPTTERPTPSDEERAEAERLVDAVLARDRWHAGAVALKAQLVFPTEPAQAVALLQRIAPQLPQVRFNIAQILAQQGDQRAARDELTQARDQFRQKLKEDPKIVDNRLGLASAMMGLGEMAEAARIIEEALPDLAKGEEGEADPRLVDAWLQICLSRAGAEMKQPEPNWTLILQLLDAVFVKAPEDPRLLNVLAVVVSQHQGEGFERLRSQLQDALADGRAPATCHLVLGTALGTKGELEPAIRHLRAARQAYPTNPLVANNLAMFLMQSDPTNTATLEEALEIANLAVQQLPEAPHVLDTRGQILFQLGRYDEALIDLEKSVRLPVEAAARHEMLATIYEKQGNADMAERHRARAAGLRTVEPAPDEKPATDEQPATQEQPVTEEQPATDEGPQ